MMTRKHFQAIADILQGSAVVQEFAETFPVGGEQMRLEIVGKCADYFATENPNFDRERFLQACGVES